MLLLMIMLTRPSKDKRGCDPMQEDRFMHQHGGWGPRLMFLSFEAVSDLFNRLHDIFAGRQR